MKSNEKKLSKAFYTVYSKSILMKLRSLGIVQIIFALIIILVDLEAANTFRYLNVWTTYLDIFRPLVLVSILMIWLGIKFIQSKEEINFHIDKLFQKVGLKISNKTTGIVSLVVGIIMLIIPVLHSPIQILVVFFDDATAPLALLSLFLIILGSYILIKSKK